MKLIHFIKEGQEARFGLNFRSDCHSRIVLILLIPYWITGIHDWIGWMSRDWMRGRKILALSFRFRIRSIIPKVIRTGGTWKVFLYSWYIRISKIGIPYKPTLMLREEEIEDFEYIHGMVVK